MIYEINGEYIEVINEINELDKYIFGRFSQFKEERKYKVDNFLKFKKDSVEIKLKNKYKVLHNQIIKTDLYTIINNVIAYLINDEKNIFIHGTIISKKGKGILIVGNFGEGKSTLAEEYKENGYEINSTDQSWIQIEDNNAYLKRGSRFDIKDGNIFFINKKNINKKIRIEKVLRLVGVCDNGDVSYSENNNKYHNIKNLSYFCSWNYFLPIFTDDVELYDTNKNVKEFLKNFLNLGIKVIDVRGDKRLILKEIGDK